MIEFVTALLGLVTGIHPVAFAVSPEVATIEIRLDGAVVEVLSEEPWSFQGDFGPNLEPHQLEAVARDAAGRELHRLEQWVNLDAAWTDSAPSTAILVRLDADVELPAPSAMSSWFLKDGMPLEVVKVEKGPAEVVFLRDPKTPAFFEAWSSKIYDLALSTLGKESEPGQDSASQDSASQDSANVRVVPLSEGQRHKWRDLDLAGLAPNEVAAVEMAQDYLRSLATLGPATSVRFVSPHAAAPSRVSQNRRVFHGSRRHAADEGGFLWLTRTIPTVLSHVRLADALAVSGRQLHGGFQRRALVMLLAQPREDRSLHAPTRVRSYLEQLQVPVEVWSLTSAEPHPDWGEVTDLRPPKNSQQPPWAPLERASQVLRERLDSQRVVWLRGRHPPQSIELSAEARGVQLAGRDQP